MTETDAKTKLCPRKMGQSVGATTCDASACMAWVWTIGQDQAGERRAINLMSTLTPVEGRCGLAN